MNVFMTILLAVQILSAIGMIGLILVQHGKGADAGAAFGGGGGGSASLFGASGSANFLSRSTAVLATVFLASTLGLAYFGNLRPTAPGGGSVLETAPVPVDAAPAVPADVPGSATGGAAGGSPATPTPATTPGAPQIPAQ